MCVAAASSVWRPPWAKDQSRSPSCIECSRTRKPIAPHRDRRNDDVPYRVWRLAGGRHDAVLAVGLPVTGVASAIRISGRGDDATPMQEASSTQVGDRG